MKRRIRGVRGGSRHYTPDTSDRWGSSRNVCHCMLEGMLLKNVDESKIPILVFLSNGGLISFSLIQGQCSNSRTWFCVVIYCNNQSLFRECLSNMTSKDREDICTTTTYNILCSQIEAKFYRVH